MATRPTRGHLQRRDPEPLHTGAVPEVDTWNERRLLVNGHLGDQLLDVAVDDDDDVDRQFSPFSDGYIEGTQPQSPSSTSSDPFERAVIPDNLQQNTEKENKLFL